MPTILTAAQILALRTGWINDQVDLRLEWGSAPAVNGSAAAGVTINNIVNVQGDASANTLRLIQNVQAGFAARLQRQGAY